MQQSKRPADPKALLLKPVQNAAGDVRALTNKDAKLTNHVKTIADGFGIFSWFALVR